MKKPILLLFGLATLLRADFALRDGDTLAFLGDSITAARGYTKIVEHYTLMRFPDRKVRFVNAGQGGDTASGSLERLQRDVFDQGATVVTVAFGINDIGWGTKADAEHKKLYLDGIRSIIERCREHHVRPIICSPAITEGDPDKAEHEFLQTMTDEGLALAKSMGAETIDLQRGMREIQRRVIETNLGEKDPANRVHLHVKDGIHLEDLGQLAMAYAMLKGLDAPADVSSATIPMAGGTPEAKGCTITDLQRNSDGLTFIRNDEGLPLNFGPLSALQYRWVPVPDGINRYLLTVSGLPEGDYEIHADGRDLGKTSAANLARGINLSSMTANGWEPGGPWDAQSCVVKEWVDARDKLSAGRALERRFITRPGTDDAVAATATSLDDQLVSLQRAAAKPKPYRFEITRIAKP